LLDICLRRQHDGTKTLVSTIRRVVGSFPMQPNCFGQAGRRAERP
jgi:hypothetical protein